MSSQLGLPVNRPRQALRLPDGSGTVAVGVVGAAVFGAVAALYPEQWRGLLALALVVNLVVLGSKWPRAAVVATLLWLPFLGLVRRLLISESGWEQNDPLLLVGPIAALFLCYRLFILEKRTLASDRISKLVLFLLVVSLLQAFNPFGVGGITGGLAGVIYLGVPLLFFFLGRELGQPRIIKGLIYATVIVAVGVGAYGLYQTEWGSFPEWDIDWFEITGYSSLSAGRTEGGSLQLRPWSTFASNGEYSVYLSAGIAFAVAMLYHRRVALAISIPFLLMAVVLAGGRSLMALTIISVMVLTAIRTRNGLLALGVVILGIATAYGAAAAFGDRVDRAAQATGDAKTQRQAGGLLNPLDPDQSTFLNHWDAFGEGISAGFTNPVGQGTGASNLGAKAGTGGGGATDNDISNVFVSYGFVGGFAFVILIVLCFRTVGRRYMRGPPDPLLLAVMGLMVISLGQWLNGGHYAASPLLWFFVGWGTRPLASEHERGVVEAVQSRWGDWGPLRRLRGQTA